MEEMEETYEYSGTTTADAQWIEHEQDWPQATLKRDAAMHARRYLMKTNGRM
jgi:hypothetical protein